ncbi:hypothetical protein BBO99_00004921 [Phytophthora kernoviae]|uniref:RRM domain-containing protein n=1 Tax=Phytophthora kernoviae TaxID=325452 RepID=A0A3R7H6C4_9STRA|nr:hypothetical protein JM16_002610 [Phytophthora kernoviae]RLN26348.1 hypothetical protein BBI17_006136 [Phytophthora kernoviae]RLN79900.1 hypothetical protein BBO99_00004921 [Phytophthora kernoviae]
MAKDEAVAVEQPKDDEGSALNELQQHLQLESFDGKYLTTQEILLLQLFQSVTSDIGVKNAGTLSISGGNTTSELSVSAPSGVGMSPKLGAMPLGRKTSLSSLPKGSGGATSPSSTTPKRQVASDRARENLVLTVPTRDENGSPEGVIVHSVCFDGDRGGYRGGPGRGGDRFHPAPHPFEVYVGNLPQGTSREELSFLFQYLGYETVRITARGFGFVTLRNAEDMNRAVEDLDGKEFNGMKLRVSCALPPK